MKKIALIVLTAVLGGVFSANAQDYKHSIGLRLGDGAGITYKTFLSEQSALAFDLGGSWLGNYANSYSLSGSYLHHTQIADIKNFKWFAGGGASVYGWFSSLSNSSNIGVGLFGSAGVDYKLENAPFAFSADIRPTYYIGNIGGFAVNFGITARYVF